jgi:sialate O-acetylesterase
MVRDLPGAQYNAGIHPIQKATIAGAIWYQGCHNVRYSPTYYDQQQEVMINTWRERFHNPQMPFYLVQLVPHTYEGINGAILRENQAKVAAKMDHVEVVITMDQTDRLGDIHPRNKQVVGERLAACALGDHYGKKVEYRSPSFDRVEYKGGAAYVYFKDAGRKLVCYDKEIVGFQLSDGGEFFLAKAEIEGKDCVKVWVDGMTNPGSVRYCFNESVGNLQSINGLPVGSFRTDDNNEEVGARPWMPEFSDVEITVTGGRFSSSVFKPNAKPWSNRGFQIVDAIEGLCGFDYLVPQWLKKEEVIPCKVTIVPDKDGRIYILCRNAGWVNKQKGWSLLPNSQMTYTDHKRGISGPMWVAYREVKSGQKVVIKWESDANSGFSPIAKKINY